MREATMRSIDGRPRVVGSAPVLHATEPSHRLFDGSSAIDELWTEWDALADRAMAPAWWRAGWVRAWHAAFGRGSIRLVTVWRAGRLVAIAPIQCLGQTDWRSTSNYHTPSFGLLAEDESARLALAEAIVASPGRRLTLAFLPASDPSVRALETVANTVRHRQLSRVLERCPQIELDGTWPDFLKSLSGHKASEIRRRRRKLETRGQVTFEVHDGRENLAQLLEDGFAVEAAGWKGDRGTAITSNPATRAFYAEIAQWLAGRGALRLAFLRLDGQTLAFDFAVEEGGMHSLLKTGFDPAFRAEAPGALLRAAMIERAFELRLRRYDFLGNDDPWKREWTAAAEPHLEFRSFPRSPAGIANWAAQRYLRPLARRVLQRHG